jgi:hypothetical protein
MLVTTTLASIIAMAFATESSLPAFHASMDSAGYAAVSDDTAVEWLRRYEAWYQSWHIAQARGIDIPDFII